jgi:hypothetical protein
MQPDLALTGRNGYDGCCCSMYRAARMGKRLAAALLGQSA